MTTSGTYNSFLNNGDIVLEAFDRCEIRGPDITRAKLFSARRSLNLELSTWANMGVNLWKVVLLTMPMTQGLATYILPANTISVLDTYVRTFQLTNQLQGGTPSFSTVANSTTVTINFPNHGLTVGQFINVQTPVSVGGLLISNFYQVASVATLNQFTITSVTPATSTATNTGTLPTFACTSGSQTITVTMINHGLVPGLQFNFQVPTTVGGISIMGSFVVQTVTSANVFTITAQIDANASQSGVYMNNNVYSMTSQDLTADPIDYVLTPLGRSEYSAQPDKFTQARPTCYWFNRETPQPQMVMWQVPDGNGPYLLSMYVMQQVQDAYFTNGQTADIPYRFQEALCANMAKRLSLKFKADKFEMLKAEAKEAWDIASLEDREKVDVHVIPDLSGYYRV